MEPIAAQRTARLDGFAVAVPGVDARPSRNVLPCERNRCTARLTVHALPQVALHHPAMIAHAVGEQCHLTPAMQLVHGGFNLDESWYLRRRVALREQRLAQFAS
jgi:hypothetical protein